MMQHIYKDVGSTAQCGTRYVSGLQEVEMHTSTDVPAWTVSGKRGYPKNLLPGLGLLHDRPGAISIIPIACCERSRATVLNIL